MLSSENRRLIAKGLAVCLTGLMSLWLLIAVFKVIQQSMSSNSVRSPLYEWKLYQEIWIRLGNVTYERFDPTFALLDQLPALIVPATNNRLGL